MCYLCPLQAPGSTGRKAALLPHGFVGTQGLDRQETLTRLKIVTNKGEKEGETKGMTNKEGEREEQI